MKFVYKYIKYLGVIVGFLGFFITSYIDDHNNVRELVLSSLNGIALATIVGIGLEMYSKTNITYVHFDYEKEELLSALCLVGGIIGSILCYVVMYIYLVYTHTIVFK